MLYDNRLQTFMAACELGSLSKAADARFVSPTAVVKQMRSLEKELGVTLLTRSSKGVEPTSAGITLLEHLDAIIKACNAAEDAVALAGTAAIRHIRFGFSNTRPSSRIFSWWGVVAADHPGIELDAVPLTDDLATWNEVFGNLGNEIDVTLTIEPSPLRDWYSSCTVTPLYKAPMCVEVPRAHKLAGRQSISIDDLKGETLWILHWGLNSDVDSFRNWLSQNHPSLKIRGYDPYDLRCYNQCAIEGGVLFGCSEWADRHPGFVGLPCDIPFTLTICLVRSKDCPEAVNEFVEAVAEAAIKQPV